MPRDSISIDSRLSAIAQLCGTCTVLADIGSDHGRLGAYLLQRGLCERVKLTDISAPSLLKARMLIARLGLETQADFIVGDGAGALDSAPDVAVIAGMGGETIAGIVERGRDRLGDARLVVQPNVDAPLLRAALSKCGYAIADERIVRCDGRLYVIMAAVPGASDYSEFELHVGPVLMMRRDPELFDYAGFRLRVARKAAAGMERAGVDAAETRREIEIWEEVAGWQG